MYLGNSPLKYKISSNRSKGKEDRFILFLCWFRITDDNSGDTILNSTAGSILNFIRTSIEDAVFSGTKAVTIRSFELFSVGLSRLGHKGFDLFIEGRQVFRVYRTEVIFNSRFGKEGIHYKRLSFLRRVFISEYGTAFSFATDANKKWEHL